MWLIILQVLINIPSIIKTVKELWALIQQLRNSGEKKVYEDRLGSLLVRALKNKRLSKEDHEELKKMKFELDKKA